MMGGHGTFLLCERLVHLAALDDLNLARNQLGDHGALVLAACLSSLKASLKALKIAGNDIGKEGADALAKTLPAVVSLETLDVSENSFGDEGLRRLVQALPRLPLLRWLSLAGLGFSPKAGQELLVVLDMLAIGGLSYLDASYNKLPHGWLDMIRNAVARKEGRPCEVRCNMSL